MKPTDGLRARKKAQTRERIADVAAGLFAARGYNDVSVVEVARAADVSDQTVYNYFPTKQDLVFDRAEEIRAEYGAVVRDRAGGTTPADALRPLVLADIDRFAGADLSLARGEFPAQCLASPPLRRFALELREQQAITIAASIAQTDPGIPRIVARCHAAALVSVVQTITDTIGAHVLAAGTHTTDASAVADEMRRDATVALDTLVRAFRVIDTTGAAP